MNKKEGNVTKYPDSIETRTALLEASISHINDTLNRIENRFDKIDDRFDKVDERFNRVEKEMKGDFRWTLTVIAALGAIMAHGFHWF